MQEIPVEDVYTGLVNSPLTSLLEQVLIIGLFVVSVGYIRYVVRDVRVLFSSLFWKRAILLGSIVQFVTYITVAYEVDIEAPEIASGTSVVALDTARRIVVTMIPLDLLGIALTVALFVILTLEEIPRLFNRDGQKVDLSFEIRTLFLVTALWHTVMIAWWSVYSFHTGDMNAWQASNILAHEYNQYDVAYHSFFALAHGTFFWMWASMENSYWKGNRESEFEWVGVFAYCTLILTVYFSRLFTYVEKYTVQKYSIPNTAEPLVWAPVAPVAIVFLIVITFTLARTPWNASRKTNA